MLELYALTFAAELLAFAIPFLILRRSASMGRSVLAAILSVVIVAAMCAMQNSLIRSLNYGGRFPGPIQMQQAEVAAVTIIASVALFVLGCVLAYVGRNRAAGIGMHKALPLVFVVLFLVVAGGVAMAYSDVSMHSAASDRWAAAEQSPFTILFGETLAITGLLALIGVWRSFGQRIAATQ